MKAKGHLHGFLAGAVLFATLGGTLNAAPFEKWSDQSLKSGSVRDTLLFAQARFWIRHDLEGLSSSADGLQWDRSQREHGYGGFSYGNGFFLMSIPWGSAVSSNGWDWDSFAQDIPGTTTKGETPVAFGNGWFVTSTQHDFNRPAQLYRTDTGRDWTKTHTIEELKTEIYGLSFANGRFVASAARIDSPSSVEHILLVSEEGEQWERFAVPPQTNPNVFASVASDGEKYVGAGTGLTTFSLSNGVSIISQSAITNRFGDVLYAQGRFVAVGHGIASSADGIDWTMANIPKIGPLQELAFGNGRFVAMGQSTFAISTNGVDWQVEGQALSEVTALVAVNGGFVGVGTKAFDTGSAILVSTNRNQWKVLEALPGTNVVTAFAHADGQYLAFAGAKAYLSSNSLDWTAVETGFDGVIAQLAFFRGRFWGAGTDAAGNGVIVEAVPDSAWRSAATLPGRPLAGIAASESRVIAVGGTNYARGYIVTSEDGMSWAPGQEELKFRPYSATHMDGRFFIGGHFGGRAVSTNGVDWVQAADGQEIIKPIVKAGEMFVAVYQTGAGGTMLMASSDGRSWERRSLGETRWGTSGVIERASVSGNRFVVPRGHVLWETEPLVPVLTGVSRSGSRLRLEVDRWASGPFGFEASEDLQNWSRVTGLNESSLEIETDNAWEFFRIKTSSSN